jgi:hypothetical protein
VIKCQLSVQKMLACRALFEHDLCSVRQVESQSLLHAIASSKTDSEDMCQGVSSWGIVGLQLVMYPKIGGDLSEILVGCLI